MRHWVRTGLASALLAGTLAACQTSGSGEPAAEAPPEPDALPGTAALDWQMTPHGPCVASPPEVVFLESGACAPAATAPGFPFYAIPYLGTLVTAGNAIAVSEASDCAAASTTAMLHNRQAAYLLAQQCMATADIVEMQGGLRRLGLLGEAETGAIDPATRAAMERWHTTVYRGPMEFGPTKEFAARVVESAGGWPGADRTRVLQ